jgi:non-specific serine/threonine protein kinase
MVQPAPGELIGRYRIVELLGRGGMGEVYLAEDTELRRSVALKTLLPAYAADEEWLTRFRREARAVAALNHPNVVTLYTYEEIDDLRFLTLEYIEGRTVKEWVEARKLMPEKLLDLARAVASGLAAAHARGIIHRDLKPANLMVTQEDRVKILDFGLALARPTAMAASHGEVTATIIRPGTVAGTVKYMAPELFSGFEADERSDLFAFGVVLYELATGCQPFAGKTASEVVASVLRDTPRPVREVNPELSTTFAEAIDGCLASKPAARPTSSLELRDLLRSIDAVDTVAAAPTPSGRSVIAVLPFDVVPADSGHAYIGDGMTDEVIADLSKLGALRVMAKSSAAQIKAAPELQAESYRAGKLHYLLEGTVQRHGDRIRVTVRLLETPGQEILWSDKFDGDFEDIFDIQDTIARTVVDALELKVTCAENADMTARPLPDIQAYEYYLRAKGEITRFREDALEKAVDYLRRGLEIMGEDNIFLNSALGYAYWQYFNAGLTTDRSLLDKAQACASRILAQDPSSAHGHRLLGLLGGHQKDLQRMVRHLKQALTGDPNDTDSLFWLSLMYGFVGRPERGLPLAERLLEIDPLTPFYNVLPGWLALLAGRFEEAPQGLLRAYDMDRGSPMLGYCYGHGLALAGRRGEAIEIFGAVAERFPEDFHGGLVGFFARALEGDREAALASLPAELEDAAAKDFQYCWNLAEYCAVLGETERALDRLEAAVDLGFISYPLFARQDPLLEGLRGEGRFKALMDRVRSLWEGFEG